MINSSDTIAAIATASGEGALAVVRLSGPGVFGIASQVLKERAGTPPLTSTPRLARLVQVLDEEGTSFEQAVATLYPGPHSYTGDDVLEISVHGGSMAPRAALEQCLRRGARLAMPGEFTLRAFLAGRIDLAQAEAVIDVIQAQTKAGLRLAHRQMEGTLSTRVEPIRAIVIGALAEVEASVDFPDDVVEPDRTLLFESLEEAMRMAVEMAVESRAGRIYRDGIRLVIMGRPNVGKSSLLNALLREARAIVTPIPGTTRDTIEETLDIGGVPVQAVDTAGLRDTLDPVESIGVERALTSIRSADIRLLVLDQSEPLSEEDWKAFEATYGEATLIVLNKSDLPSAWSCNTRDDRLIVDGKVIALASWPAPPETVEAAAALDEGIDRVEQAILRTVFGGRIVPADSLAGGGMRQSIALEHAAASLRHASATVQSGEPIDLVSVDLHGALQSLGEITGQTAPEDLLHEIFGRFCIGK